MKLSGIHPGDIVRVNDGLPYHPVVLERERVRVRIFGRVQAPLTVKAAWIVAHWPHVVLEALTDSSRPAKVLPRAMPAVNHREGERHDSRDRWAARVPRPSGT